MKIYCLILLYFLSSCAEAMTRMMRNEENKAKYIDDLALERKWFALQHFDPAPSTRIRRKANPIPVAVKRPDVTSLPYTLKKNPVSQGGYAQRQANPIPVAVKRPDVTSLPYTLKKNPVSQGGYAQRKHRSRSVYDDQVLPNPAPTVNALPLSVVQKLVNSIYKNNNKLKIGDIVRDLKYKLDIIKQMDEEGRYNLRQDATEPSNAPVTPSNPTTTKPVPKDTMTEMDKLMQNFLRGGLNGTSSESGSLGADDKKQSKRGAGMTKVDSEGDELIYDLEGDNPGLRIEWPHNT